MKKFVHLICAVALLMCAALGAFADTGQAGFECELAHSVETGVDAPVVAIVGSGSGEDVVENELAKVTDNFIADEPSLALNTIVAQPIERYDKSISL